MRAPNLSSHVDKLTKLASGSGSLTSLTIATSLSFEPQEFLVSYSFRLTVFRLHVLVPFHTMPGFFDSLARLL